MLFKDRNEIKEIQCENYCMLATSADKVLNKPVGGVAWFVASAVRQKVLRISSCNIENTTSGTQE